KRVDTSRRPWMLWSNRLLHPLPFLAVLVLLFTAIVDRLHWSQWMVIGVYLLYLFPYIGASYYESYAIPLMGAKVLLVIWGSDRLLSLWPRKQATESKQQERTVSAPPTRQPGRVVPLTH